MIQQIQTLYKNQQTYIEGNIYCYALHRKHSYTMLIMTVNSQQLFYTEFLIITLKRAQIQH